MDGDRLLHAYLMEYQIVSGGFKGKWIQECFYLRIEALLGIFLEIIYLIFACLEIVLEDG